MVEQVGLRVALGELLVALTHHVRHMAEQRHLLGDAKLHQVAVQHDLTRGGAEQVLAAQHDVDVHHRVVDRVGERVQRIAVRAHDDIVRHGTGLEFDGAADEVVEGDVLVGHADAQRGLAALGAEGGLLLLGEVTVVTVVAEFGRAAGGEVALLDLVRSGEGLIGVAGFEQLCGHILVDVAALGLAVRAVGATHVDALVPVDAQPAQGFENLVVAFLGVAHGVGVFDAEDQLAAGGAGFGPVEQRRTDHADMRRAGRRWAEAHANMSRKFWFGVF